MNETHNSDQLTKRNCSKIILLCILNLKQILCAVKKNKFFGQKHIKKENLIQKTKQTIVVVHLSNKHTHITRIYATVPVYYFLSLEMHIGWIHAARCALMKIRGDLRYFIVQAIQIPKMQSQVISLFITLFLLSSGPKLHT